MNQKLIMENWRRFINEQRVPSVLSELEEDIIGEAAVNPSSLTDSHALINNWLPGNTSGIFILFDAEKALSAIRDINENGYSNLSHGTFYKPVLDNTKGMIRIDQMLRNDRNPYGAYQVSYSSAESGYGPLMYDLVLSVVPGGIYPDRSSTSKSARRVWKYYADRRTDVVKSYIDNFSNSKTAYKYDDGIRYREGDKAEYDRYNTPFKPSVSFGNKSLPPDAYLNMVYSIPGADVNNSQVANSMKDNYGNFLKIVDDLEVKSKAIKFYKDNRTSHSIEAVKALTGMSIEGLRQRYFGTKYRGSAG